MVKIHKLFVKEIGIYILLLTLGLLHSAICQINEAGLNDYLTSTIKRYDLPGIAFAVVKSDSVIKKGALGYADIKRKVNATTQTIYPIASMDKQLIATCVMMLYEQGKLRLEDKIENFIPDTPLSWQGIEIRHLLSHTSGIPNKMPDVTGKPISNERMLSFIQKQKLAFQPGDDWLYSDAGFVVLQIIVEKITGISFDEFQNKNIIEPLGMTNTKLLTPAITQNRAMYYDKKKGGVRENTFRLKERGPLYNDLGSSIDDFIKLDIAISRNKLLKSTTYDIMWSPFRLKNGSEISNLENSDQLFDADRSYGYAWLIKKYNHHRIIYHSGYTGTSITRFPDDSLTVILFSNLVDPWGFHPDIVARHIAEFFLPGCSPYAAAVSPDPRPGFIPTLQELLSEMRKGNAVSALIDKRFSERMATALPHFNKIMDSNFGSLISLEYLMQYTVNDNLRSVYKASYERNVLYYQFELNADDKIELITAER